MINIDKIMQYKKYIIAAVLLIAALVAWNVFSGGNSTGRVNEIKSDLQSVGDKQQSAIVRLGTIENGLTDSASKAASISEGLGNTSKSIDTVKDRISIDQNRLTDSASLISEGQRIIYNVQQRNGIRN
jgi:outer membrane murein-binding lipoprotein Lpp